MLDADFLARLRCPKTGSELTVLTAEAMEVFNQQLLTGKIRNELGIVVMTPLEGLLVNADHSLGYPIRDGVVDFVKGDVLELNKTVKS